MQLYPRCSCWVAAAAAVAVAAVAAAAVVAVADDDDDDDVVGAGWQWTRDVAFPETCKILFVLDLSEDI